MSQVCAPGLVAGGARSTTRLAEANRVGQAAPAVLFPALERVNSYASFALRARSIV
jgi:hypothetical protein